MWPNMHGTLQLLHTVYIKGQKYSNHDHAKFLLLNIGSIYIPWDVIVLSGFPKGTADLEMFVEGVHGSYISWHNHRPPRLGVKSISGRLLIIHLNTHFQLQIVFLDKVCYYRCCWPTTTWFLVHKYTFTLLPALLYKTEYTYNGQSISKELSIIV